MKKKPKTVHTRCEAKALRALRASLRRLNASRRRGKLPTSPLVDEVSAALRARARYVMAVLGCEGGAL